MTTSCLRCNLGKGSIFDRRAKLPLMMPHGSVQTLRCGLRLAILLATAASATAQEAAWFQHNLKKDPERFEGLTDEPNALRELDVLDFLMLPPKPPGKAFPFTPEKLDVHYCQLNTYRENSATIEVRPLTGHVNYLMKATPGPSVSSHWVSFAWPTDAVIKANHIDPNRLGVVIHALTMNDSSFLVPAYFSSPGPPPTFKVEQYSLVLAIRQKSLDRLSYTIRSGKGVTAVCHYQNDLQPCMPTPVKSAVEAGTIVRLPMTNIQPGPVTIHVSGSYHDSDETLDVQFHFLHQPQCD